MNSLTTLIKVGFSLLFFVACTHTPTIPELSYPLDAIEKSVVKSLVKVRKVSQNRRDYTSEFLMLNGKLWDPLSNETARAYVTVSILGERRPYSVDIEAIVEERPANQPGYSARYKVVGQSKKLVDQIAFRIEDELRRTQQRNFIDDFKAF